MRHVQPDRRSPRLRESPRPSTRGYRRPRGGHRADEQVTPPSTSTPEAPSPTTIEAEQATRGKFIQVRTAIPASLASRVLHRLNLRILDVGTRKIQGITRQVRGVEHLDEVSGPYIIACNHLSLLDSPMLHLSLPRRHARRTAVVGGLDFFAPRRGQPFAHVLWRRIVVWFIRSSINVALIDRSGGDYSNFELIEDLLSRGWCLIIFPEATRSRSGRLGRMRLGVAELARRHACPVLPCHFGGTDTVLPIGRTIPQAGVMRISIGAPIRIEESESTRMFIDRLTQRIDAVGMEKWPE